MPVAYDLLASKKRVNVLKKVKINGDWRLCPAVIEPNGKLKDKVRVNGRVESHSEGVYYLEWHNNGRRMRESVRDRSEVLHRARLKALEFGPQEQDTASLAVREPQIRIVSPIGSDAEKMRDFSAHAEPTDAAHIILRAFESVVQQAVRRVLADQPPVHNIVPSQHQPEPLQPELPSQVEPPAQVAQPKLVSKPDRPQSSAQAQKDQTGSGTTIAQAIESYLLDLKPPQREEKTYKQYRTVLYLFRDTCEKRDVKEITRDDCLNFIRHLYSIGNSERTAHNRITVILQLLKLHGITGLLKGRDMPKYVETRREMYEPEELKALFKVCDPDEKLRYQFFLLTGERDKEVQHTTWEDIDFARQCVRVTAKKQLGFKPKDKEEREIPVPVSLLDALREHRRRQPHANLHNLVFPTSKGRPDKKFENKLKHIAYRAGLNCGRCKGRFQHECSSGPHCGKWGVHKFRHTFATMCLEAGHSVRTVQEWLGHSDLESTMAYLKYVRRDDIHELVDSSQLASFVDSASNEAPGENISRK